MSVRRSRKVQDIDKASFYFLSLRSWWEDEGNKSYYPGGIVQAARWLQRRQEQGGFAFDIRATENDPRSFTTLASIAKKYNLEVRSRSFSDPGNLDWLVEGDDLVVLLDPFRYVRTREAKHPEVDNGYLDLATLRRVLDACASKRRVVIHIWASRGHKGYGSSLADLREDMSAWVKKHGQATSCQYRCGNYGISVVGIHDGILAVGAPPDVKAWKRSWLSRSPLQAISATARTRSSHQVKHS